MNVSRNFLLLGIAFLLLGLILGMVMAGSGDRSLAASHAHINLVGFVLPVLFGLSYHAWPAMTLGRLATIHFWMHAVGAVLLNLMLFLMLSGRITEASMAPLAPIGEALVVLGVILFGWQALKHAR